LQFDDDIPFAQFVTNLHFDRLDAPSLWCRDIHRRLVGLHGENGILSGDVITFGHIDFDDFDVTGTTEIGNPDFLAHVSALPIRLRLDSVYRDRSRDPRWPGRRRPV